MARGWSDPLPTPALERSGQTLRPPESPQTRPAPAGVRGTPVRAARACSPSILQTLDTGGLLPALEPSTLNINQIRI